MAKPSMNTLGSSQILFSAIIIIITMSMKIIIIMMKPFVEHSVLSQIIFCAIIIIRINSTMIMIMTRSKPSVSNLDPSQILCGTQQARKLGRCDSSLQNLKTLVTDPIRWVGARRCYRI